MKISVSWSVMVSAVITISLGVEATDIIDSVKAQIQEQEDIPADRQRLFLQGGNYLLEGDHMLSQYRIEDGDSLDLVVRGGGLRIFVQTNQHDRYQEDRYTFEVDETDTVGQIKTMIHSIDGIPVEQQHLIFEGHELENGRTISQCGIEELQASS